MRRLIIPSFSALILLCTIVSTHHNFGLQTTHFAALAVASPVQATAGERGARQSAQESDALEPGKPTERELSGGQSHSYKITVGSGQYLQIVVDQRGIDVVVELFRPDGQKLSEEDSPNGTGGPEIVSVITEAAGTYRIEVR